MFRTCILVLFSAFTILAQIDTTQGVKDTIVTTPAVTPAPEAPGPSKWYYGGTVGFNFWSDYFLISVEPMVGYKVSPKFSIGGKVQYTYINDSRNEVQDLTYNNYGVSVFGRYRPVPKLYLHTEFVYANYDQYGTYNLTTREFESDRVWVPFLLLGAGFVQPVSANTSVYAEILFDVLQDDNSPYEDWDPIIHVGVGVGF